MTSRFKVLFNSTLILLASLSQTAAAGENWPGFQNGGNTSVNARHLPLRWSPTEGIAWQIELPGYGQSAPVIWQGRIFVTAVEGDEKETNIVMALDALTGDLIWKRAFSATVKTKNSYMVSRAAPTPLVDSQGVYVMFESGDLHALSHDGDPRWRRTLFDNAKRAFQNGHGYGASPAQTPGAVIVLVDHRGPSYLLAISKETGDPLWKTARSSRSSWTSPHVTRVGGHTQVVVSSAGTVDGYDADTGKQLWSHAGLSGNVISSATVDGDRVYVGASVPRGETNGTSAVASNCSLQITPDVAPGYRVLWQAEKALSHYVSPLVHRGRVYYVNKVGVVFCLDAKTGKQQFAQRISGPCWAQPIAAGERVYFFGKDGITTVLAANATFKQVASNRLWSDDALPVPNRSYEYQPIDAKDTRPRNPSQEYLDPIVYAATAVDKALIVRLGTHLYRIGEAARAGDTK